jgi:hypothetical protein
MKSSEYDESDNDSASSSDNLSSSSSNNLVLYQDDQNLTEAINSNNLNFDNINNKLNATIVAKH